MQLQFKNSQIYFAVESIWAQIDYRLKFQLHNLVAANSEDDFIQTVDVQPNDFIQIYRAVSAQPEGVATKANETLEDDLMPQLIAAHNLQPVMVNNAFSHFEPVPDVEPNEAGQIILGIQQIKQENRAVRDAKVLNGKTQILS